MLRPYKDKCKPMLAHKGLAVGWGAEGRGRLGRSMLRPYKDKFKPMLAHKELAVGWGAEWRGRLGRSMLRPYKDKFKPMLTHAGLAICGGVEGDVDYGFEVYRGALFGGGAEFPLAEGLHSVGIELLVDATDQLNAVDRAVAANHGVQHDFSFHMFSDQRTCGRRSRAVRRDSQRRHGRQHSVGPWHRRAARCQRYASPQPMEIPPRHQTRHPSRPRSHSPHPLPRPIRPLAAHAPALV